MGRIRAGGCFWLMAAVPGVLLSIAKRFLVAAKAGFAPAEREAAKIYLATSIRVGLISKLRTPRQADG